MSVRIVSLMSFDTVLFVSAGSIMFFFTMCLMDGPAKPEAERQVNKELDMELGKTAPPAYDNSMFTNDDGQLPTLELPRFPPRPPIYENSRL